MKKKKKRNFVAKELASRLYAQRVIPSKKHKDSYYEEVDIELNGNKDSWYESMF